jgi:DNA-directed RNA polymerase subunit RPC12/RpoP
VTYWDGSTWQHKSYADAYVRLVSELAPGCDRAVLTGLLELAVHKLAAENIGATLLWYVDGSSPEDPRGGLVERHQAIALPPLSVARRAHFGSIASLLRQVDLATGVTATGDVGPAGIRLGHTREAGRLVPPLLGSRHTSARRFTFDVGGVIAIVVSDSGRVTVLSGGAVAATITPTASGDTATSAHAATMQVTCASCGKTILASRSSTDVAEDARCPTCGTALPAMRALRVIGVSAMPVAIDLPSNAESSDCPSRSAGRGS